MKIDEEVRNYLTGTRGRERKRRGREQTPTPTHLARSGQTLKGQGKRKQRQTGAETEQDQRRRGGRKRLNQPMKRNEATKLQGIQFLNARSCVSPSKGKKSIHPKGQKTAVQIFTNWVHNLSTSPDTKETKPEERGHA